MQDLDTIRRLEEQLRDDEYVFYNASKVASTQFPTSETHLVLKCDNTTTNVPLEIVTHVERYLDVGSMLEFGKCNKFLYGMWHQDIKWKHYCMERWKFNDYDVWINEWKHFACFVSKCIGDVERRMIQEICDKPIMSGFINEKTIRLQLPSAMECIMFHQLALITRREWRERKNQADIFPVEWKRFYPDIFGIRFGSDIEKRYKSMVKQMLKESDPDPFDHLLPEFSQMLQDDLASYTEPVLWFASIRTLYHAFLVDWTELIVKHRNSKVVPVILENCQIVESGTYSYLSEGLISISQRNFNQLLVITDNFFVNWLTQHQYVVSSREHPETDNYPYGTFLKSYLRVREEILDNK